MRSLLTAAAASAAATVLLLTLTACTPFTDPYTDEQREGGVTPESAEALINSLDGVTGADYETVPWYSPGEGGLFSSEGMDVVLSVTVDPEYSVADPAGWVEFLAATAWSVNEHLPKGSVVIVLTGGQDRVFDWQTVVRDVFGDESINSDSLRYDLRDAIPADAVTITAPAGSYGDLFGRWPSDPVEAPAGLIAHVPPRITVVPAISDASMNEHSLQDEDELYPDCFWVEFVRGIGGAGEYSGVIEATVYNAEGAVDRVETITEDSARICYSEGSRPVDPSITLVTEPVDGFTGVTVTLQP